MTKIDVRVKKLHPDAVIPVYAHEYDAGFDLVSTETTMLGPGAISLIPTGLSFQIPIGYELQIRPRSGISFSTKLRVANSPGTVDSQYRGEVRVIMENTGSVGTVISKGDRIAQGVLAEVPRANFVVVDELDESTRGANGFGSTGVKS